MGVKGHLARGCLPVRLWTLGFKLATLQLGDEHPDDFWSFPVPEPQNHSYLLVVLNQAQQCGVMEHTGYGNCFIKLYSLISKYYILQI